MFGIRIASSELGYNPRNAWWGLPRIRGIELPVVAKYFCEQSEVYVRPKAFGNGHSVVVKPVCGELYATRKALVQIPQKSPSIGPHALADAERGNQFCFRVNRNVNPLVANFGRVSAANVPRFLPMNVQISSTCKYLALSPRFLASDEQESHDRITIESGEPLCAADRASLKQTMQRTFCRVRAGAHGSKGRCIDKIAFLGCNRLHSAIAGPACSVRNPG